MTIAPASLSMDASAIVGENLKNLYFAALL